MNSKISDKLDKDFRKVVFEKFGMKKGNLDQAVTEALEEWVLKNKS